MKKIYNAQLSLFWKQSALDIKGDGMLILTRRVGETLMIGDEVTVTVLGVKGNQVRIGVNAPKDVSVHREEIYERIKKEQSESKSSEIWKFRRDGREAEGAPLLREYVPKAHRGFESLSLRHKL